jgi:RimJ/RimL family protein N-acetyltransferase
VFTLRRMEPADKPAMTEISSRIWDGTDHVPRRFDEWVADREGEFTAVLLDGRLVGCGKLTFFTPAHAWLEGLRKDPRVTEPGLARAVTRRLLASVAARGGISSVRFSTYVDNQASIAVNEAMGFRRAAVLSRKTWEGSAEDCARIPLAAGEEARRQVAPVRDARLVRDFLEGSGCLAAAGGLLVDGWYALPPEEVLLAARYVGPGRCRGVARAGRLAGLCISRMDQGAGWTGATVAFLDAEDAETAEALFDDVLLRLRGAGEPVRAIEWMVPGLPRLKRLCAARGLASGLQEDDYFVYELPRGLLPSFLGAG